MALYQGALVQWYGDGLVYRISVVRIRYAPNVSFQRKILHLDVPSQPAVSERRVSLVSTLPRKRN